MSMNLGPASGDSEVMVEMNTTPLIDVMLVLLIMLIITIPIQTHAVKLDMPQGEPPPQTVKPEVVKIDILDDGTVLWNDGPVPDERTLEFYFHQIGFDQFGQRTLAESQAEIHVRPNPLAKYDVVARVLATAQRNNAVKIGIVGGEQFM